MTPSILNVNSVATMSSLEMAELAEKRHDSVKRTINILASRKAISQPQTVDGQKSANGVVEQVYLVGKRDSYVVMAQLSPEFTARLVDRWQELEAHAAQPVIDLNNPEHLRGLLGSYAEKAIALQGQLDHAIATKAHIGDKRQATAMANTAKANREAAKLRDQLGFSARHATILQVEDALGGDFNFLPLRNWCKAHEVTPEVVPDKRYPKGVKAWPAGAWLAVYGVRLDKLFGEVVA